MDDPTTAYYRQNAEAFFADTFPVEMEPLYNRFLPRVRKGGHLLDAGCGSGRDSQAFLDRGYRVTAFDASPELARLASRHTGQEVLVMRFEEIHWQRTFDGIWACASLLHVPAARLPGVMARLAGALKPGGTLYASFKHGQGEREHKGRRFTDLDEGGLAALLAEVPGLSSIETWVTGDLRPGRAAEPWLNALLRAD
jgi:2-polyprenyl-3-methyl-5-hydroxy-6-metoxy-1,4-benzoquinol methylase